MRWSRRGFAVCVTVSLSRAAQRYRSTCHDRASGGDGMAKERRLMYIEFKGENLVGPARIGWVTFPSLANRLITMASGSAKSLALRATTGT